MKNKYSIVIKNFLETDDRHTFLNNSTKILSIIFSIAFFLRVAVVFYVHNYYDVERLQLTAGDVLEVVHNIVDGKGFSGKAYFSPEPRPTSWMAPIYPYFLSGCLLIFGSYGYLVIEILQCIASAFISIILYLTGKKLFNKKAGFIAAILAAFYPPLMYYCTIMWGAIFFILLINILILFLFKVKEIPTNYNICLCGFLMGFTALVDPVIMCFYPFVFLWLFFNFPSHINTSIKNLGIVLGIMLLVISPWTIRNYLVFNKFVLIKSNIGHAFWVGNNPRASGNMEIVFPEKEEIEKISVLTEVERERIFITKAFTFIKENPKQFVSLFFSKLRFFWWKIDNKNLGTGNKYVQIMYFSYGIILFLALCGIIFSIAREKFYFIILILFLFFSLSMTYSLTAVGTYRYRLPVEPYLLIFAALTINIILKKLFSNQEMYLK
ncbi:MAG TPA: hypothetical protein DCE80_08480 [Ignavibacteriales bacterium]|nr:hypothetical protein [Ignavibacteriales bacterium]